MLKQIALGLFIAGLGGAMIYFSAQIVDMFGRVSWFENNLGGTRNGYVFLGFCIATVGFLILFGVIPVNSSMGSVTSVGTGSI